MTVKRRTGPILGAPNFTYDELIASATAKELGLSNVPDATMLWSNLQYLATAVLQPVRDHFGLPIVVTSGYRSPRLNAKIGGSKTSHHVQGCAADIRFTRASGRSESEIFKFIYNELPFTELIAEGIPGGWVHVAIARGRGNEKAVKYMLDSDGKVRRGTYEEICKFYEQFGK